VGPGAAPPDLGTGDDVESDEQTGHDADDEQEKPEERPRRPRELPPPSSQAWAIVAPQLIVRRPNPE
jgi:hypothetical protein